MNFFEGVNWLRVRYIWCTQSLRYTGRAAQAKAFALLIILATFSVRHAMLTLLIHTASRCLSGRQTIRVPVIFCATYPKIGPPLCLPNFQFLNQSLAIYILRYYLDYM